MIGKFLSSQFSGYLAIAAIIALIGGVWFIRHSGYTACEDDYKAKAATAQTNSIEGANDVRKKEQSLDHKRIIAGLDKLGILRPSNTE